ncbi:2-keto-4-pentenoate hydratase/2-oxohepta-3-ene-1,7-dioic acid hydratase in catechol pathway [Paraburkholderia sp. BL23I1N1]|uniref:fumarylacetoacetate hydrolase family protein n=1 Tax=Paraburkholderia sp. BL23I1N1 TaxID=1938802 RepID=UPI000E756FDF|nr:fumarylacetoacetate hydrolase family protein [Paraburkholderia sp. BL23I1N1]RKE38594.1 2-keto-4-pentenoate hydratase/2-oxohepta-3-ene-1,7-dioic acid hydratase in catechol pathway [Paraburkholderia sp. BL23I1N1]
MRFIAFRNDQGQPALGLREGDTLVDLTALGGPQSLDILLRQGEAGLQAVRELASRATERRPLTGLEYLPPVLNPAKAFAIGLNYKDHAAESNFEPPKHPVVFQRYPSSWVAHGKPLVRPHVSVQFDYEAEFVAVIGKPGRYIPKERALEHVAGYSLFNDGSVRDYQLRTNQWMLGKNFDDSGSFGPEFVTADELPPGANGLELRCRLNGDTLQSANTADMIFDVATLVAACSDAMLLQPGDIIITGTPSGVGLARTPQVWMKDGDVCEVEVEGIGVLRNPVIDEHVS